MWNEIHDAQNFIQSYYFFQPIQRDMICKICKSKCMQINARYVKAFDYSNNIKWRHETEGSLPVCVSYRWQREQERDWQTCTATDSSWTVHQLHDASQAWRGWCRWERPRHGRRSCTSFAQELKRTGVSRVTMQKAERSHSGIRVAKKFYFLQDARIFFIC